MKEDNEKQLEQILEKISEEAKPDAHFEQILKVKLRERFHHLYEKKEVKTPFFQGIWRLKIQFTSALILVLFTSTTIYAYNSDEITNGHILYPLKRSAENVEEIFATSPESKTSYYNKMAGRRIRELSVLESRGVLDEPTIKETDILLAKAEISVREIPEVEDGNIKETPSNIETNKFDRINLTKTTPLDSPRKTKREKAIEEISEIRSEFQRKYEGKLFKAPQPIRPVIEKAKLPERTSTQPENTKKLKESVRKPEKKVHKDRDDKVSPLETRRTIETDSTITDTTPIPTARTIIEPIVTPLPTPALEEPEKTEPYNLHELKRELKKLRVRE